MMEEIKAIQDESGRVVIVVGPADLPIRDQATTGNSRGSKCSPIQLRRMAEAGIAESPDRVHDVPRPSTPKEAASVRTDRVLPLKQRKKILAKRMAKK